MGEGACHGLRPNGVPIAVELTALDLMPAVLAGETDEDETNGLLERTAARPGDAGDGDRDIGLRAMQCALRHSLGDLAADRAMRFEQAQRDAQLLALGLVGI